jgi:hypothetical protein
MIDFVMLFIADIVFTTLFVLTMTLIGGIYE